MFCSPSSSFCSGAKQGERCCGVEFSRRVKRPGRGDPGVCVVENPISRRIPRELRQDCRPVRRARRIEMWIAFRNNHNYLCVSALDSLFFNRTLEGIPASDGRAAGRKREESLDSPVAHPVHKRYKKADSAPQNCANYYIGRKVLSRRDPQDSHCGGRRE